MNDAIWRSVPLADVAGAAGLFVDGDWVETKDQNPEGEVRLIQLADVGIGEYLNKSNRRLTSETARRLRCTLLRENDILVARMPDPIGRACLFPGDPSPCATVVDVCIVRPDPQIAEPRYLLHFLNSAAFQARISGLIKGATRQRVSRGNLQQVGAPLPPLDEQRRIAAILDQADDLRRKRRRALSKLNELPGRVLVETYGEPASNPMNWPITRLGDVCGSLSDGPHVSPEYVEAGVPFLSTRNIRSDGILWSDLKFISEADAQIQWKKIKPAKGDVLYTKGGTTGIARAVDFELDFAVWVHVAVLKLLKNKVEPVWLQEMLNSSYCYRQSQRLTKGIVNRDLGLRRMVDITFPLPPLGLQGAIATRVAEIDKLKAHHRAHLAKLNALFASLQYRAFRGEL